VTQRTAGGEALLTIDELATATGMTVRNVRFYATKGLLPPPVRRGRVGYYGLVHRLRLDLVRELQDNGYALAGIERHLSRIPLEATSAELAVYRARLVPWEPERAERFDRAALDLKAGQPLSDDDVAFLIEIGILTASTDDHFQVTPSMLAFGVELLGVPVPRQTLREAAALIERHAGLLATGLTEVFGRGIWEPFRRGELTGMDAEQLASVMTKLRPLTVQGLVVAFEQAADRVVRNPDKR
jgi:DNA-binding transcriptional MerR regulator